MRGEIEHIGIAKSNGYVFFLQPDDNAHCGDEPNDMLTRDDSKTRGKRRSGIRVGLGNEG
jgi:hypothetical protein